MRSTNDMNEKPLVDKEYLLEKSSPGKGGWTFTIIPEILPDPNAPFSWVKVRGSIDGHEIEKYHLMPSGRGSLMLAVKSEIRKKIRKQAGDYVHVILYPDNELTEVPEELMLCLQDDNEALRFFNSLNDDERHSYIKWIYSAKVEEVRINRMAQALDRLSKHKKIADKA